MDDLFYLFLGYTLIWVLIFFYTFQLGKRQRNVEQELDLIRKIVSSKQQ